VFLYNCGSRENMKIGSELTLYTERWGLTLRLPQAEELGMGGDYFLDAEKEDNRLKTIAELRRLLYVAMTRAESELFVTGCMDQQNENEKKDLPAESFDPLDYFYERYAQFRTKPGTSVSFFRLLPPLDRDNPLYTLEPIFEHSGKQGAQVDIAASADASRFTYEAIPEYPAAVPVLLNRAASSLHLPAAFEAAQGKKAAANFAAAPTSIMPPSPVPSLTHAPAATPASSKNTAKKPKVNSAQTEFDFDAAPFASIDPSTDIPEIQANIQPAASESAPVAIDTLIEECGIKAEEFGTLVHHFIEERFGTPAETGRRFPSGTEPRLPPQLSGRLSAGLAAQLETLAAELVDGFFTSALGKQASGAIWRESEFSFVTAIPVTGPASPALTISGAMDLVFESDGIIHVVDFKTDRVEDVSRHLGQLAVYRRAAGDLFPKDAAPHCWLFYLRSSTAYDVTPYLETLDVESLL
jgi:ATP-dependent helicase/nuclease subunit A